MSGETPYSTTFFFHFFNENLLLRARHIQNIFTCRNWKILQFSKQVVFNLEENFAEILFCN